MLIFLYQVPSMVRYQVLRYFFSPSQQRKKRRTNTSPGKTENREIILTSEQTTIITVSLALCIRLLEYRTTITWTPNNTSRPLNL
jgi:hypothetical protein